MTDIIYDIRTKEEARTTLEALTGIPFAVWEREEETASSSDQHIEEVMKRYGGRLNHIAEFVLTHLTSSANGCAAIRKNGLTDLCRSYENNESELRQFLDQKGITLNLDHQTLRWNSGLYSIANRGSSLLMTDEEQALSRIGYRFFRDQCVCGFLSLGSTAYLTHVEEKPEILIDIGNFIGMDIAGEWKYTHESYAVTAKVRAENIVRNGDDLSYACLAYWNSFHVNQNVLLCKDGVQIPPEDILSIEPFAGWQTSY